MARMRVKSVEGLEEIHKRPDLGQGRGVAHVDEEADTPLESTPLG